MDTPVVQDALAEAGVSAEELDAIAVTFRPGLIGSLLVGLSFAKGLAWALGKPLVGVDHILAHLYAPHLEQDISYPYLGVLVSGGHTIIARVERSDSHRGSRAPRSTTPAARLSTRWPSFTRSASPAVWQSTSLRGPETPALSSSRSPPCTRGMPCTTFRIPGLKTAVIHQSAQFWDGKSEKSLANIAASFQRAAIDILVDRALAAAKDTGLSQDSGGRRSGGEQLPAANGWLRRRVWK